MNSKIDNVKKISFLIFVFSLLFFILVSLLAIWDIININSDITERILFSLFLIGFAGISIGAILDRIYCEKK